MTEETAGTPRTEPGLPQEKKYIRADDYIEKLEREVAALTAERDEYRKKLLRADEDSALHVATGGATTTEERIIETSSVLADYLERLSKAATPGPWNCGELIEGYDGDFVIWKHRGLQEAEFPGPQREFVGNVGHFIQPVVMHPEGVQLFDGERADSELITALRNNLSHIIGALRLLDTGTAQATECETNGTEGLRAELDAAKRALAEEQANARRYRWLRSETMGDRHPSGRQHFLIAEPTPVGNIMQGSVAEHLDDAIDAALAAKSTEHKEEG